MTAYRSFATTVSQLKFSDFSGEKFKVFEVLYFSMGATTAQLLSSGEFYKLHYDTAPVKSASADVSLCTNNSKNAIFWVVTLLSTMSDVQQMVTHIFDLFFRLIFRYSPSFLKARLLPSSYKIQKNMNPTLFGPFDKSDPPTRLLNGKSSQKFRDSVTFCDGTQRYVLLAHLLTMTH